MRYVAGIDGGATKTRCLIGDLNGNILGDYTLGASNHQTTGQAQAKAIINDVYFGALKNAKINPEEIEYVFLGLAGADLPSDFELLNNWCSEIFLKTQFYVANDVWIAMRSGIKGTWGAVSICGTGSNAGACHPDGRKNILNSISYELGNYGGGGHITEKALHYAFRAFERTGKETALVEELPKVLGATDMADLLTRFYPVRLVQEENLQKVPPLVFKLANNRDWVCQKLLIDMGHVIGEMISGVIKGLGMEDMEVPVVLGGSVYKGDSPLLIDELNTTLHMDVPGAHLIIPTLPPAAGALLSAMDSMGIVPDAAVYQTLEKYFK